MAAGEEVPNVRAVLRLSVHVVEGIPAAAAKRG
jgi:hypothetical protein